MIVVTVVNVVVYRDLKSMQWASGSCFVTNCVLYVLLSVWTAAVCCSSTTGQLCL